MSSIMIDRSLVHYEAYGQGEPVILVHGWLGSWRYWLPTMKVLAEKYRTYGIDLWGFGDSDKSDADRYTIADYADLIYEFMQKIGIERATYVGHSMGGLIGTRLALQHPEKISKLIVVGSPIVGRSVSFYLRLLGQPRLARMVWGPRFVQHMGHRFLAYWLAGKWHHWYQEIVDDTAKVTHEAACLAMRDMVNTDLSPELPRLPMPLLAFYGKKDNVVDPKQANLYRHLPNARLVEFNQAKHFPMLDEPERFYNVLLKFMDEKSAQETGTEQRANSKTLWRRNRNGGRNEQIQIPPPKLEETIVASFHQTNSLNINTELAKKD